MYRFSTLAFLLLSLLGLSCGSGFCDEEFGPAKPKVIKTPFTVVESDSKSGLEADALGAIEFAPNKPLGRRGLSERLGQSSALYLPEKMVLGRVSEFTVKGKPGKWVALAMADKDTGSKPVMGHKVRLGPDRKVVAIAQIPSTGLATLLVECPVEGDLVGSHLFFEAAIWTDENIRDIELAQCVPADNTSSSNGVLIQPQFEQKKGVRLVPTTVSTFRTQGQQQQGLSSPQP